VKCNELSIAKLLKAEIAKRQQPKVTPQGEWQIEGVRGLSLIVTTKGVASWCVRYQTGKGKARVQRRRVLGRVGADGLRLADARAEAIRIMGLAAKGVDEVAVQEAKSAALTLKQLWDERR